MSTFVYATTSVPGQGFFLDAAALGGGGGDALLTILNRPRLVPNSTDGFTPMLLAGATPTLTFTAPKNMLLRNIIFFDALRGIEGVGVTTQANVSNNVVMTSLSVAGTGPNAGTQFLAGGYYPLGQFSIYGVVQAPTLDIAMAAGDVLSMTLAGVAVDVSMPLAIAIAYDDGLSGDDPTYFLGIDAALPGIFLIAPGAAATTLITVVGTPTAPGNRITIQGDYGSFGSGVEGGVIDPIGGSLFGSAGGGASGTNTWNSNTAGITPIRDAILAALQDGGNKWASTYTFSASGAAAITGTRSAEGTIGNADTVNSLGANLTVTGPTGGTSPVATKNLAAAPVDLTLNQIVTTPYGQSTLFYPALQFYAFPSLITSVAVAAAPAAVGAFQLMQGLSTSTQATVEFDVDAGQVVTLSARSPAGYAAMVGASGKARA